MPTPPTLAAAVTGHQTYDADPRPTHPHAHEDALTLNRHTPAPSAPATTGRGEATR